MTKVLFIAYQFPPLNVGGSFRPLKFVKYFNDFQIEPFIITLDPKDYAKVYKNFNTDYNLLNEIKDVKKKIIHIPTENLLAAKNKISSYFNFTKGKEAKFWKKNFFKITQKLIEQNTFKAIIITAPPFSVIALAVKLAKKNNLPLIIDMRDSMSMWVYSPYATYLHFFITKTKEKYWFKNAYKIIAVTKEMIEDWKKIHKHCKIEKFQVIPNGFDENIAFDKIILKPTHKLTIGYIGSFYYNPENRKLIFQPKNEKKWHRKLQYVPRKEDWLYRSPFFFFKTLHYLFEKKPELKNKIFVKFAGNKPKWLIEMIENFKLQNNVELVGFLSSDALQKFKNQCDAWLSTSVKIPEGRDYCIAGKTFDYITDRKPIFAFVSEGAQKDFLINSGMAVIFDPDNIQQAAEKLENILHYGITLEPNKSFLERYHRKFLTKKLADIIHSLPN